MNSILNFIVRWAINHCHTITCTTFETIVAKDRMGYLKRNL
jgi:hypothetical protein